MAEETMTCSACGCACSPSDNAPVQADGAEMDVNNDDVSSFHEETKLAVLIALVPAMTMTVFNLMGLI